MTFVAFAALSGSVSPMVTPFHMLVQERHRKPNIEINNVAGQEHRTVEFLLPGSRSMEHIAAYIARLWLGPPQVTTTKILVEALPHRVMLG